MLLIITYACISSCCSACHYPFLIHLNINMADKKLIWTKNDQVYAITFPGERTDSTYGTLAAEVDLDFPVGVGDIYPPKEASADTLGAKKATKK
ncbi:MULTISPECIES: hypothetical protein [Burkholderia]|uniref:hypothetical protein n=1 Tax=Burkholderia TaxID=32008 RepID=UPI000841A397|nr:MULTISPECIES: hypothetical protein [unclassified Burkholderia]AOK28891.1 hypothetical protein AQ611_05050 [Burkholderia sp. Bp7605]